MPNQLFTCKIGLQCLGYWDLEFKMSLLTSVTGSSDGPGEILDALTVIKMLQDFSPMSQEQIETLISNI